MLLLLLDAYYHVNHVLKEDPSLYHFIFANDTHLSIHKKGGRRDAICMQQTLNLDLEEINIFIL